MTDPITEIDTELEAEALSVDVPYRAYVEMSPRERGLAKARKTRALNAEARKLGVDPEWWNGIAESQREEERPKLAAAAEKKQKQDDAVTLYTEDADVPAIEADPRKRDGITIGRIEEKDPPPDVIGNERVKNPRTLMDLYARWPVGDGQHYIRVERVQPKVWQGVRCAGYLADIKEQIPEAKFQQYFGGTEYELTLYGPDPSGKTDAITGLPKIKALTNSFKLVVPTLPPNLAVLPALRTNHEAQQEKDMTQPWNPYAAAGPTTGVPTTPADAQIAKTNADLLTGVLKITTEENERLRRRQEENGGASQKHLLDYVSRQSDQTLEQARADALARETILRDQIQSMREELRLAREEYQKVKDAAERESGKRGDPLDLVRVLGENSKGAESTAREFYEQRLRSQEDTHRAALATLDESHKQEIRRADERLKDNEQYYKRMIDEERRKFDERERALKDEVDRVRREERELSDKRIADMKERYEERLKDQEKAYEREIRSVRDMAETRMTTTVATKDFELAAVRERFEEAKKEAAEARAKAEENNDPAKVLEKAKAQAEALGYKGPSDDPKSGWERFGTIAGEGVKQFMSKADTWLPGFLSRYQGPPGAAPGAAPQLPPGMQRQQQQPLGRGRPRGVAWAAANQEPPTPVNVPDTPLGFETAPQAPQPQQPPPQPPQPAPRPQPNGQQNPLRQAFSDTEVMGFLQNLDGAINIGIEPSDFAARFIQMAPEAAAKAVSSYKPDDVVNLVKGLPGSDASAILRRDGRQFLNDLWAEIEKQQSAPANAGAAPFPAQEGAPAAT